MNFVQLNRSLFTYTWNIRVCSQYNSGWARNIKHCLLETLPALVGHNILRGVQYMAKFKFPEKSDAFIKHKVFKVISWQQQTNSH
jgi:hypothetical protein